MMKAVRCSGMLVFILLLAAPGFAQSEKIPPPITLPIWPAGYLKPSPNQPAEHDSTTAKDDLVGGKTVIRLADVSDPTIMVYRPDPAIANKTAIVVLPGGGYYILAMDLEGTEICRWLNARGVTAILVKYRVLTGPPHSSPLQDVERAFRIVRAHASQWNIDPNRIGIMGFSAGGDLAARISNDDETRNYTPIDAIDRINSRPDFTVLIYPAYLAENIHGAGSALASDIHVGPRTPPAFLAQAEDDPVGVMNSIDYYAALVREKIPSEIHIYSTGGHGYGVRPSANSVGAWPLRLEDWLRYTGMIAR
jgi:acetyl esterase/lipase